MSGRNEIKKSAYYILFPFYKIILKSKLIYNNRKHVSDCLSMAARGGLGGGDYEGH